MACIYNPGAGKHQDQTSKIAKELEKLNIKYEFLQTKGRNHAIEIVNNMDFDEYSAIVCIGGDGTIHEVVNGMMYRKDKRRLPLAFLPNGTGNDLCLSLSLNSIDSGLKYIAKG